MLMISSWYILEEAQYQSFEIKRPEKLHVSDDDNIMMIMIFNLKFALGILMGMQLQYIFK